MPDDETDNMLAPLRYSRASTLGHISDGPGGSGGNHRPRGNVRRGGGGVHPLRWAVDGHWLGRWRTPLVLRLWRYGAGSIVAFVTSAIVLSICFSWLDLGAFTSSTLAFFAGAVPNWLLNRRWAWQRRGRQGVGRETTLYVVVTLVSWLASSGATKLTATESAHVGPLARGVLVVASYMFSVLVLTGLKYLAYDRWVFVDRSPSVAAEAEAEVTAHSG
jgi:putative flippase GtrA